MDLKTIIDTIKVAGEATGLRITGGDKLNTAKKAGRTLLTAKNINKINSIAGKARASIAQYPILVSENLNPKLVPILTNAMEVEYASLLYLTINNVSSFDSGDASSVIGKFHNSNSKLGEETFLCGVDDKKALCEACNSLLEPYEDAFNMKSLNESYYTKSVMDYLEEKKKFDPKDKDLDAKLKIDKNNRDNAEFGYRKAEYERKVARDAIEQHQRDVDRNIRNVQGAIKTVSDVSNSIISIQREIDRRADRIEDRARMRKEFEDDQAQKSYNAGRASVTTKMKDLAKLNDMHPTILNMTVNFREPESESVVTKELSIGVKCVSHLLKSDEVQYYLTKASYKNNAVLRVIKWTTGEIKFWKDLIFALDDIKLSALQNSKTISNKNYFSKLEYMAKTAKSAVLTGSHTENIPSAITTLIITKTDVENIKYKDGINILSNPEYLKKIFNNYYLLNLLIVDESLDVVHRYDQFSNTIVTNPISSYEKSSKERVINANDLFKLAK